MKEDEKSGQRGRRLLVKSTHAFNVSHNNPNNTLNYSSKTNANSPIKSMIVAKTTSDSKILLRNALSQVEGTDKEDNLIHQILFMSDEEFKRLYFEDPFFRAKFDLKIKRQLNQNGEADESSDSCDDNDHGPHHSLLSLKKKQKRKDTLLAKFKRVFN